MQEDLGRGVVSNEAPAHGGKVALFALAVAVVLGAVLYGLAKTDVSKKQDKLPIATSQTK